jgi:hypothetical protein
VPAGRIYSANREGKYAQSPFSTVAPLQISHCNKSANNIEPALYAPIPPSHSMTLMAPVQLEFDILAHFNLRISNLRCTNHHISLIQWSLDQPVQLRFDIYSKFLRPISNLRCTPVSKSLIQQPFSLPLQLRFDIFPLPRAHSRTCVVRHELSISFHIDYEHCKPSFAPGPSPLAAPYPIGSHGYITLILHTLHATITTLWTNHSKAAAIKRRKYSR